LAPVGPEPGWRVVPAGRVYAVVRYQVVAGGGRL